MEDTLTTIASRSVIDKEGIRWWVREATVGDVPGAAGRARCLIFESQMRCTRLWEYPDSWRTMSVGRLLQVLESPRHI